jgi:hypothetical protein
MTFCETRVTRVTYVDGFFNGREGFYARDMSFSWN